ncbi:hypothetical protein RRG08_055090 [Elysia crispata]|uniref:Uncharacterized protein n=1 Tax=Elysia crispata TaxID=231223 RepID=A0AAE1DTA3_9GAST|nr:hypothetical protein RRG08_055090 [Elysia crispata]
MGIRHSLADWYEAHCEEMEPVKEAKRKALLAFKATPGPILTKTAPLKSKTGEVITDQTKQMQRWGRALSRVVSDGNIVTVTALDAIPDLSVMEELDHPPTVDELSKVMDCLAFGKAPEFDGIPSEVLKSGKPALLQPLHDLLCLCWE